MHGGTPEVVNVRRTKGGLKPRRKKKRKIITNSRICQHTYVWTKAINNP